MTEHEIRKVEVEAFVYSRETPTDEQLKKVQDFLEKKYNAAVAVIPKQDDSVRDGFRIEIGTSTYKWNLDRIFDWSAEGRAKQLKQSISEAIRGKQDVLPMIRQAIEDFEPVPKDEEVGTVLTVGDGIATISGLEDAEYGEILLFECGIKGMILDLKEDEIGCVIFGDESEITEGSMVRRTKKVAGIPVGEAFMGRVINALGEPVDGKGPITQEDYYPIENPAPGIIDRQPVNRPMETGLLSIDSMFPIGRGQRELIIGDRQTGKTAIALDTIVNQKGKDVICIYVAIGQKASSVAQLKKTLETHGAMDYTIIVNATASDPAPLQYIAPYAGCAMGEYFMNKGRDVLIVYDDLSKHAIAYRAMSLLLERSPGREAYPGDVFYLHSRLLERAAHLSEEKGGGSITALPIIETQSGDVSAYIPTNVISITDGQLILETRLFFSGQRPAVNVGLSVSRVGGDAQTKAMKKAAKTIRLDLSQYREMESFTQFASDLDESTAKLLSYGQGLMRMLRQKQFHPYKQYEQVILLVAGLNHVFQEIVPEQLDAFIPALLQHFGETQGALCNAIEQTGQLSDDQQSQIIEIAKEFVQNYFSK